MKHLILIAGLAFSAQAMAISECAGRGSDGSFVMVHVETVGANGMPSEGEVSIEHEGNKFGYRFGKAEISQYFENDDVANASAIVGVVAFAEQDSPISIKYVGPNFADMDLKAVIDEGKAQGLQGNFVRVWKGPGHTATDQFEMPKVACSVWSNL